MPLTAKLSRWALPVALTGAVTLGACAPKTAPATARPDTAARLEIVAPGPNETLGPNFVLNLNLTGAKIVPANVIGGPLKGDEGHIHVTLDGKLISVLPQLLPGGTSAQKAAQAVVEKFGSDVEIETEEGQAPDGVG